jgi:hypothetical protein
MSGILTGEKEGGGVAAVRVDEEGRLEVTAAGGAGLATEATLQELATALAPSGTPTPGQPAIVVVDGDPPQMFAAAVPAATEAPAVRIVGDALDRFGNPILQVEIVPDEPITVIQGPGSGDPIDTDPWLMLTVKDMTAKTIATEETLAAVLAATADDPTIAGVQEVRDRLPQEGARLAVETELAASGGLAVEARQVEAIAAVDDLEADADATRVAAQSLDAKALPALGTAFVTPVRGTATNVAVQLGSLSTPRGFNLDNIDASGSLYVGNSSGLTTANGYKVEAGFGVRVILPNPNALWIIADTTAAYQIGAVS